MRFTGSATSSASSLFPDLAAQALGAAGGGKAERESRQQARFASHADLAAVQLRDRLDDRQTETGAGRGFLARAARPVEPAEDARQGPRPDPPPRVGHLDP